MRSTRSRSSTRCAPGPERRHGEDARRRDRHRPAARRSPGGRAVPSVGGAPPAAGRARRDGQRHLSARETRWRSACRGSTGRSTSRRRNVRGCPSSLHICHWRYRHRWRSVNPRTGIPGAGPCARGSRATSRRPTTSDRRGRWRTISRVSCGSWRRSTPTADRPLVDVANHSPRATAPPGRRSRSSATRSTRNRVEDIWEAALGAPLWSRPPVWLHGDLDARNLLATDGRLSGVLDFGALAVGDPAADVMVAWKMFGANDRASFRSLLDIDDATWLRAQGWVLSQALMILSYYTLETNRILVLEAQRWMHACSATPVRAHRAPRCSRGQIARRGRTQVLQRARGAARCRRLADLPAQPDEARRAAASAGRRGPGRGAAGRRARRTPSAG